MQKKSPLDIKADEKRDGTIYARVKPDNKKYLEQAAKQAGVKSFSKYMDQLIEQLRAKNIV